MAVLAATLALAGCDVDSLLEVNDPDTVNPGTLNNPDVIDVVIAGAIGDFVSAYGGGESYLTVSGVMSDEFFSSGSFPTRTATDQRVQFRSVEGNTSDGTYRSLQFARRALAEAAERVAGNEDLGTGSEEYQELKSLEGYSLIHLGEGYCSAVPISTVSESGEFVYGEPLTSAGVLQEAITRFDAAGDHNLAAIGKARALLNLAQTPADYAAAAAEVADVPTDYTYFIFHSQSGTSNAIFSLQGNGRYSQSSNEGTNGLAYRNGDPRTPWVEDPDGGFTETIPLYLSLKYTDYDSPVVMASGVEARLIEAEAEMEAGNYTAMTLILNDLRADVATIMASWVDDYETYVPAASLAPLTPPAPGDREGAIDQLFAERAYWMFLTGHRLGDLRRLVYQKGRLPEDVYPTGAYHKSGNYGDDVVFPLDFDEVVNPNFEHDMCNVDAAAIR